MELEMAEIVDFKGASEPFYYGGPTGQPIRTIPDISQEDWDNFTKHLNYAQGICHSAEVLIGRWEDPYNQTDSRITGQYVMGEKLMHIVTALGYANVGFVTDMQDRNTSGIPLTAGAIADAVHGLLDLASANGWMIGDILQKRIKLWMEDKSSRWDED